MNNVLLITAAFLLVLMNAFFVAAEFGMVKLRNTRVEAIKANYGLRGYMLEQVHKHLDAYLSACQLGITLASLGLGWIGEPAFAHLMEPLFHSLGIGSPQIIKAIAFFTAFSIISFLHIVVGELMPKSLAIRRSEAVSVWTALPLYGFYWLMYPAIWVLNTCSNFLLKKMGLDAFQEGEHAYSTKEIKLILSASHLHGELSQEETEIIEHTLEFAELQVTEVMRHRDEIVLLNVQQPIHVLMQIVIDRRYSRYPVYDPDQKDVIGIVHVKDLFAALYQQKEITNLLPYVRPILKVSHQLPAIDLLRKFREGMPHFALIYKGKENLLGFVTLDNLLHVLIGRIKDEFHKTQDDWIRNTDNTLTVKGDCSIYSLERALDCDITLMPDEEDLDTLAGLIIVRSGRLPKIGDKIRFKEFDAVLEDIQGSYIRKVKVIPKV
ncbi:MAG: HlyC/CorC family transporter [Gammaproteobacteria bacterium]|nr:HlyC/CorC family transporter [Gammaproteobacteria bacterium]MCW5584071.1 HlyC/CorC family transporter [Gammaproteobacteria bacterium]